MKEKLLNLMQEQEFINRGIQMWWKSICHCFIKIYANI